MWREARAVPGMQAPVRGVAMAAGCVISKLAFPLTDRSTSDPAQGRLRDLPAHFPGTHFPGTGSLALAEGGWAGLWEAWAQIPPLPWLTRDQAACGGSGLAWHLSELGLDIFTVHLCGARF